VGETTAGGQPFSQLQVNLPDTAAASDDGNALLFTDAGTPPGMPAHDWAAAVGANVQEVRLDGRRVSADERETNRALEVTVPASPGARHTLVVTAR